LQYKGYGMSQPIAPNSLPDGTDNPEGRQQNRRTEFKIVGVLSE
jgi:outer membrane protein OmpA-like peptidoglycan-associated protein